MWFFWLVGDIHTSSSLCSCGRVSWVTWVMDHMGHKMWPIVKFGSEAYNDRYGNCCVTSHGIPGRGESGVDERWRRRRSAGEHGAGPGRGWGRGRGQSRDQGRRRQQRNIIAEQLNVGRPTDRGGAGSGSFRLWVSAGAARIAGGRDPLQLEADEARLRGDEQQQRGGRRTADRENGQTDRKDIIIIINSIMIITFGQSDRENGACGRLRPRRRHGRLERQFSSSDPGHESLSGRRLCRLQRRHTRTRSVRVV